MIDNTSLSKESLLQFLALVKTMVIKLYNGIDNQGEKMIGALLTKVPDIMRFLTVEVVKFLMYKVHRCMEEV